MIFIFLRGDRGGVQLGDLGAATVENVAGGKWIGTW
jgi:hypothetical protein